MKGAEHPSHESLWRLDDKDVRDHLAACPACTREHDRLNHEQSDVAGRLALLAGDVSVPTEVAQRLQQAVAAQARGRDDRRVASLERAGDPADHAAPGRTRWVVAASAAALAVLGVGVLIPLLDRADQVDGADVAAVITTPGTPDEATSAAESLTPEGSRDDATARVPDDANPMELPAELLALGRSLTPGESADPGCGRGLAAQVGAPVLASRDLGPSGRAGVLVLLDGPTGETLWWLPGCGAGPSEAWGRTALV